MISDLKYFDGSLGSIDRVPEELKQLCATAFEIDATRLRQSSGSTPEMDRSGPVFELIYCSGKWEEARCYLP